MSNLIKNPQLRIRSASSSNNEIFKCEEHFQNVSMKLQAFYVDKEFFDIILIAGIDRVELQAHRIILSASSNYFLAMFRNNLGELRSSDVELEEIDGATLKQIVDFMYTASIELSCEMVESVLKAADFFQMDDLIAICCNFMSLQLNVSNCLGIALFAEQHSYKELYKKSLKFAYKHFEKVCGEKQFNQLNDKQLAKFIKDDHRYNRSEEKLFLALIGWVEHDEFLEPKFIVENRPSVGKSIESDDLIFTWLQWHLSPETRTVSPIQQNKSKKLVFVTADQDNLFRVSIFNSELNFWLYDCWPCPSVTAKEYSTVVINNTLIIAGGMNSEGYITNDVQCLDLETMEWTVLAPMLRELSNAAIVELNDLVYVIGGFDGEFWKQEVYVYDFTKNSWTEVAPLPQHFENVRVAVLFGVIYAASDLYFSCYDPDSNEWTHTADKYEECTLSDIVAVGEYLYAVEADNVKRFDPSKGSWTLVNSLPVPEILKCVAFNNRIVACAETDDGDRQQLVHEYNPQTNKWTSLAPLLQHDYLSYNLFTV